jgi:hypothetical protein
MTRAKFVTGDCIEPSSFDRSSSLDGILKDLLHSISIIKLSFYNAGLDLKLPEPFANLQ